MIWYVTSAGCGFSNTIKICSPEDVEKHMAEGLAQLQGFGGGIGISQDKRKDLRSSNIFQMKTTHISSVLIHSSPLLPFLQVKYADVL